MDSIKASSVGSIVLEFLGELGELGAWLGAVSNLLDREEVVGRVWEGRPQLVFVGRVAPVFFTLVFFSSLYLIAIFSNESFQVVRIFLFLV